MRRDLRVTRIFRLLQFSPVGHERPLAIQIVRQVDFRSGRGQLHLSRRGHQLAHPRAIFRTLAPPSIAAASATTARIAPPRIPSAGPATTPVAPGLLLAVSRRVAVLSIQYPSAKNGLPRLDRWLHLNGRGGDRTILGGAPRQRPSRRLRPQRSP